MKSLPDNEWSEWFDANTLDEKSIKKTITADQDARDALARRLKVDGITSLSADVTISPVSGGAVEITGTFKADIQQTCVVTLEPMETRIEEPLEGWFTDREKTLSFAKARQDRDTKKGHVEVEMLDEHEDPEDMIDGHIDLGELVTQHLSLAIDPYPHKPGVTFDSGDDKPLKRANNPFEALKDLQKGSK